MRITKTLSRESIYNSFLRESNYVMCVKSIQHLLDYRLGNVLSVNVTLATKNPKQKGFKKCLFIKSLSCDIDGCNFSILPTHLDVFRQLEIKLGDYFWMKATAI
jgi:hypothetical protein